MQNYVEFKFNSEEFEIRTINAGGGHRYIVSSVNHNGKTRRISVFFENKQDEDKLKNLKEIYLKGVLKDDGNEDLLLKDAVIINYE